MHLRIEPAVEIPEVGEMAIVGKKELRDPEKKMELTETLVTFLFLTHGWLSGYMWNDGVQPGSLAWLIMGQNTTQYLQPVDGSIGRIIFTLKVKGGLRDPGAYLRSIAMKLADELWGLKIDDVSVFERDNGDGDD